jgi:uncharacterized phage protein (TIGR02216 family)
MSRDFSQTVRQWGHLALSILGWSVDEFWRATPEELRMGLVPAQETHAALNRTALDKLLAMDAGEGKIADG